MDLKDVAVSEECRKSGEGAGDSTPDLASTLRWSTKTVLQEELRGSHKNRQDRGGSSDFVITTSLSGLGRLLNLQDSFLLGPDHL